MVCWKIWTWFRIMKISVSSKSFEMHLSFSFAASFCSSVSKSEKLPQMKKSHESNVLRSKAGFSAQMISWVSAARSEKQILSTQSQLIMCTRENISFRRSIQKVVSELSICVSMPLVDVVPLTIVVQFHHVAKPFAHAAYLRLAFAF